MSKTPRLLLPLFLLWLSAAAQGAYSPGQLIIRLRSVPRNSVDGGVASVGIPTVDARIESGEMSAKLTFPEFSGTLRQTASIVTLTFPVTANLDSLENALSTSPDVEWVTRNHLYQTNAGAQGASVPNDSLFGDQWWLRVISAPLAWEITTGDTDVVIGIIDTGVDYMHPDLVPNLWHNWADADSNGVDDDNNGFVDDGIGWDFVDAPSLPSAGDHLVRDNDPMDELGHGTYVAGIASAATDNHLCYASVGYRCRIMPLRAGNSQGYFEEDDIAAALLYGAQNGASIINMSFGDNVASPLLREAVLLAHQEGVVMVASAGNESSSEIHYPSGFPEVISVGASDSLDRRAAGFSNFGPTVDVLAPGTVLKSTLLGGECGEWTFPSGTSYASPLVCGIAGLVLSAARARNAQLSPDDVAQIIVTTADDLGLEGWDPQTAHGRVNARRAVERAAYGSDVVARISMPEMDQGLSSGFAVRGEAWGATFDHYELSYGLGENPSNWIPVATGAERRYGDSLGWIELPPADTVMIVRLQTFGTEGAYSVANTHIYVQRSAPGIDSLSVMRMLDGDSYGDLVQVRASQVTTASFIMTNAAGDSVREDFGYVSDRHAGLLSQENHPGEWTVRVRLENRAGMVAWSDPFTFAINEPPFASNLFERTTTNLENGYLGPFTTDQNCNGRPEVWLQPKEGSFYVRNLQPFEWNGSEFEPLPQLYGARIPRATGDADADGLNEVMATFFRETKIWEQTVPCGPDTNTAFRDTLGLLGVDFVVIDSATHQTALLANVKTDNSVSGHPRYALFSIHPDYSLTPLDTLPNLTHGENQTGAPSVLSGDLDGDGQLDFLYGDYDGNLIFCEMTGGQIVQQWSDSLPQNDATAWYAKGDLDGDGQQEFVAGCRSSVGAGSESELRSLHWEYFVYERTGDNAFSRVDSIFIYGSENPSDHLASVTVVDVDADGKDDILISSFPDFYIISYDSASARYQPKWYYFPSESNTCLAGDWDGDGVKEFFMADGQSIVRIEAVAASGQRPLPSLSLQGEPISAQSVFLNWSRVQGADSYFVYRAATVPDFARIASTTDTFAVISGLPADVIYTYAVTTFDPAYPLAESVYSNYLVLAANNAPALEDTSRFVEPHFVRLRFSEPMGETALQQWSYRLDEHYMPDAIEPAEGGRVINLVFLSGLTEGWHTISVSGLRDAQEFPLPEQEDSAVVHVEHEIITGPHVLSHRVIGGVSTSLVEISYSEAMSATVLDPGNYRMESPRRVVAVRELSPDLSRVQLQLDPRYPVGSLGRPARIMLRNLMSAAGEAMDTTGGRADLLLGGAAATISDVFVYPNPYRGSGPDGESVIVFAGLPEHATIRVFTLQGTLVKEILHASSSGAAKWDLRNEHGDDVASGVYLFAAESGGETVRGKFAVFR